MTPEITLILTLSTIVVFSPFIARVLRIPTTPVEIVFGAIATYFHVLPHDVKLFEILAEFGFLFLMFIAGTEVNMRAIFRTEKIVLQKGVIYLILLYILSFAFARYLDLSNIFILIMPLISVGLVATLAKEFGNDMDWIKLSFIIGSIGELISITLLTISSAVIKFGFSLLFVQSAIYLMLFLAIILLLFKLLRILFWWYPELRTVLMPYSDNKEQDMRLSFALLFVFLAFSAFLDLELAFGAFIAGIFLPTFFQHKEELPEKLSSLGFGFVIPIFFIYIGSNFSLEALTVNGLVMMAFVLANSMILIRILSAFIFYKNLGVKGTFLFAFSHAMPLTLLIAVATVAYHHQSIDQFHYFAFILASLFEVIFSMIAIKIISSPPAVFQNLGIRSKF